MTLQIIFIITSLLYASIEGSREAYYYSLIPKHKNIHWLYFIQRGLFAGLLFFLANLYILGFFILAFSFFHNGFYYITRNNLDKTVYPKRFIDSSTTSTAILEFNFIVRTLLFVAGIILLILNYVL